MPRYVIRYQYSARQCKAECRQGYGTGSEKCEVLEHPAYSPDLSPRDYHIFGPLKKSILGQLFRSDHDVKAAVLNWSYDKPTSFFADGNATFLSN
ncbi:hypothetical protein TNCV_1677481 [Trichonephila clavipes]|nr:hypothetical protein TNCV_1677481 [Trichonephila clavipes]